MEGKDFQQHSQGRTQCPAPRHAFLDRHYSLECELTKKNREATIDRIQADLQAAKTKWEGYCARRRESHAFALEQSRRHKELLAQVEAELNLPKSLRRYAKMVEREEV